MRLSGKIFSQIVESLKSDKASGKDKRLEPRVGLGGDAPMFTINEAGQRASGIVRVRDVSRSGIGLIGEHELATKQRFVVQLEHEDDEPLWLVCTTAYCRALDGGHFTIGARISQVLHKEEIRKMEQKNAAAAVAAKAVAAAPVKKSAPLVTSDVNRISKAVLG